MPIAAWLVDVGYVVKASEGKFKLDYLRAREFIRKRFGPVRAFLFNGFDPAFGIPEGLQAFYAAMKREGMQVRLHPMQSGVPGANRQRRVDVDLSAHFVWQAGRSDVGWVLLTSGDQDFIPAVEIARRECGKPIVLFTYTALVHHDLINAVDEWLVFDEMEGILARW